MSALTLSGTPPQAWITIDRPERKHAWAAGMWTEMVELVDRCAADDSVRVVLISSTGDRVFSAGADIEQFHGANEDAIKSSLAGVESVMASIEACPKPVIAVVSGAAVGAGMEVAAACDLRLASDNAWFSIPAAALGIVITRGDINRLARGVGGSMARDMLLTGRRLTAAQAERIGFVRSVHGVDQLHNAASVLADEITLLDGSAQAAMKRHLNSLYKVSWDAESWAPSLDALLSQVTQTRITARMEGS